MQILQPALHLAGMELHRCVCECEVELLTVMDTVSLVMFCISQQLVVQELLCAPPLLGVPMPVSFLATGVVSAANFTL